MAVATIASMDAEMAIRVGRPLALVGLCPTNVGGSAQAWRIGFRKGLKAVGVTVFDPLNVQDADVASLSSFALERVLDEAELFSLERVIADWYRAGQDAADIKPVDVQVVGGWLLEAKQGFKARIAELKVICSEPYREPSDTVVIANDLGDHHDPRHGYGWGYGWPGGWP